MAKREQLDLLREFISQSLTWSSHNKTSITDPLYQGEPIRPGAGKNILDDEEDDIRAEPLMAACVLILSDDGKILAVSRRDDPSAYGMPGGKVDPGETPEEAASRELEEETGLVAGDLNQVFKMKDADGYTTVTFTGQVSGKINTEEEGVIRWVKPSVLLDGPFGNYMRVLFKQLGLGE